LNSSATQTVRQSSRRTSNWILAGCGALAASILLILGLFLPASAGGQEAYGTIVGTVIDATGAVVPGVNITLVNKNTAEQHAAAANDRGGYQFVNLLPGTYTVTFERQGFKKLVHDDVEVKVSTVSRIDAEMQVGAVETQVVVTAQAPLIDTQSSTVGAVVEGKVVEETPLNGRNVMNLIALEPGVVPQGSASGSVQSNQHGGTFSNPAGWGNYQIGGGMSGQSAMFLDGQPLNGTQNNSPVIVPAQDIIQEFRVETNTVSPEYGRFAGGVVIMTTKQGSNKWHGSAYEYLRNKDFNANDFFSKQADQPRAEWTQNQYGAFVGAPIKKEKAFFFASWEGFRLRMQDPNTNVEIPTAAEMGGDFSAALNTAQGAIGTDGCGNNIYNGSLFDPTSDFDPMTHSFKGDCVFYNPGTGAYNVIPQNRWDNTGAYIINHYYTYHNGTAVPAAGGAFNLWSGNGASGSDYDQITGRVDYNMGARHRLFARYTNWNADTIAEDPFKNGYGKPGELHQTHQATIGDTYTISDKTIADLRFSYSGMHWDSVPPSEGKDMSVYDSTDSNGFGAGNTWTTLANQLSFKQNLDAASPPGTGPIWGLFMDVTQVTYDNILGATGSVIRIQGRHTLKAGGEWRYTNFGGVFDNTAAGQFMFVPDSPYTGDPNPNPAFSNTGSNWADLLMGMPVGGSTQTVIETGSQMFYGGLYAMDTFQLNRKLTLNYGVRWEQPGAFREHHDLNTVFLPGANDPDAVVNEATVTEPGLLALVNSSDYRSRYDQDLKWDLFVPRAGFAYRLSDKTVVKGGFGMSFLPSNGQGSSSAITAASNAITPANVFPAVYGTPEHSWLQNAYNNGTELMQPAGRNTSATNLVYSSPPPTPPTTINCSPTYRCLAYGSSISVQIPNFKTPTATQWNLIVGQDFGKGMSLELGYVGAKGTHLPNNGNGNINQLPESAITTNQAACDGAAAACPLLTNGGHAVAQQAQLLFPYPQYVGVTQNRQYWGSSIYHGLQALYKKNFQQGSNAQVAYTWSKMISDVDSLYSFVEESTVGSGPQDQYNHRAERSISSFDVPQHLTISYFLALPIGKAQRYGKNASGFTDRLIGGWGINGITNFQTGFPLAMTAPATSLSSYFNAGTPRPDITCNPKLSGAAKDRLSEWFTTTCFAKPGNFSFGNAPRNQSDLRANGIDNWDLSAVKKTALKEGEDLEFRAEFFNIANHPQFAAPDTGLGDPQFSVVTSTANKPRLVQFALRYSF
jgi:hypothetical protein